MNRAESAIYSNVEETTYSKSVFEKGRKNETALQPISARIEKQLYKDIKLFSVDKEIRLNDLIETALREFIKVQKSTK